MSLRTISAKIQLLTTAEGGRKSPLISGYSSLLRFAGKPLVFGFELTLAPEVESLAPGDASDVQLTFWATDELPRLFTGSEFELYEGDCLVGRGEVTTTQFGRNWESRRSRRPNLSGLLDRSLKFFLGLGRPPETPVPERCSTSHRSCCCFRLQLDPAPRKMILVQNWDRELIELAPADWPGRQAASPSVGASSAVLSFFCGGWVTKRQAFLIDVGTRRVRPCVV